MTDPTKCVHGNIFSLDRTVNIILKVRDVNDVLLVTMVILQLVLLMTVDHVHVH